MSLPTAPIRLIVGLGNPGKKYEDTRHNAGFWLVDEVVRRLGLTLRPEGRFAGDSVQGSVDGRELRLLEPQGYMNRSGESVAAVMRYFKLSPAEVLVAHDELDLEPGTVRLKYDGGHGGHNGLRDIHRLVGSGYWRLRIGIGHPGHKSQVVSYVLGRAERDAELATRQAIHATVDELASIVAGEMSLAMNRLHSRQP